MLAISIALALVVALCAAQMVCITMLADRVERLKKENASLRLAATHWEGEAHSAACSG